MRALLNRPLIALLGWIQALFDRFIGRSIARISSEMDTPPKDPPA